MLYLFIFIVIFSRIFTMYVRKQYYHINDDYIPERMNLLITGGLSSKRPVFESFDIFVIVSLTKLLNKLWLPVVWDSLTVLQ